MRDWIFLGTDTMPRFPTSREPRGSYAALERLLGALAKDRGLSLETLKSDRRNRSLAYARHDIVAIAYATGKWSLPTIGRAINKDHTTVLYGVRSSVARRALAQQEAA